MCELLYANFANCGPILNLNHRCQFQTPYSSVYRHFCGFVYKGTLLASSNKLREIQYFEYVSVLITVIKKMQGLIL